MIPINRFTSADKDYDEALQQLLSVIDEPDKQVIDVVANILADVKNSGDTAIVDYTNRFDNREITADDMQFSASSIEQAVLDVDKSVIQALEQSTTRIRAYHEKQLQSSWSYEDNEGTLLGQQVTSLQRVGVYVPGGLAAYPSTALMNIIPARVAGVKEIIMVTPTPNDEINPAVLAAAHIAGADQVFSIGGAQAVAGLAYGTQSIPAVDKIVGPGNKYVAEAKRQVYGIVGIDMIAGPSEVLILADANADPDWLAMDLFAQAEHDKDARSILISTDEAMLDRVMVSIEKLLPAMERKEVIQASLENNGALIGVSDLTEALNVINHIAPEHLELAVSKADDLLPLIHNAGAIFIGYHTAEVFGDYCAGPNHVLPTGRTARFSSPLGVYDFQKRSSLIRCNPASASGLAKLASPLARAEGLTAHARSAEFRNKSD